MKNSTQKSAFYYLILSPIVLCCFWGTILYSSKEMTPFGERDSFFEQQGMPLGQPKKTEGGWYTAFKDKDTAFDLKNIVVEKTFFSEKKPFLFDYYPQLASAAVISFFGGTFLAVPCIAITLVKCSVHPLRWHRAKESVKSIFKREFFIKKGVCYTREISKKVIGGMSGYLLLSYTLIQGIRQEKKREAVSSEGEAFKNRFREIYGFVKSGKSGLAGIGEKNLRSVGDLCDAHFALAGITNFNKDLVQYDNQRNVVSIGDQGEFFDVCKEKVNFIQYKKNPQLNYYITSDYYGKASCSGEMFKDMFPRFFEKIGKKSSFSIKVSLMTGENKYPYFFTFRFYLLRAIFDNAFLKKILLHYANRYFTAIETILFSKKNVGVGGDKKLLGILFSSEKGESQDATNTVFLTKQYNSVNRDKGDYNYVYDAIPYDQLPLALQNILFKEDIFSKEKLSEKDPLKKFSLNKIFFEAFLNENNKSPSSTIEGLEPDGLRDFETFCKKSVFCFEIYEWKPVGSNERVNNKK